MSRIKGMIFNDQMEYLEDQLESYLDDVMVSKQIEINQWGYYERLSKVTGCTDKIAIHGNEEVGT
jgi:hypothetical protein